MSLASVKLTTAGINSPKRLVIDGMDVSASCFCVETRHSVKGPATLVAYFHLGDLEVEHLDDPDARYVEPGDIAWNDQIRPVWNAQHDA